MSKRTVSKTISVSRQSVKTKDIDVTINIPEDCSPEEEQMLVEEAAIEQAHDADFNYDARYADSPVYFIG
jgi:tRNA nucleotidyltransferase (CCA-adding enzyme)